MHQTVGTKTTRRWPRFGLRALLATVTALSVLLGYLGIVRQRVLRQRRIVQAIERIGGKVRYDFQVPPWQKLVDLDGYGAAESFGTSPDGRRKITHTENGVQTVFVEMPLGPWIIRRFLGDDAFAHIYEVNLGWNSNPTDQLDFDPQILTQLPRLEIVVLSNAQVNDQWLASIARIPRLRFLHLSGGNATSATANGLSDLQRAQWLAGLSMRGDWIRDDMLKALKDMPGLTSLNLSVVPNLTGDAFASIAQLDNLHCLSIVRAPGIADSGSEHLTQLKKLRGIYLTETSIADATARHLAALPDLQFVVLYQSGVGDDGLAALASLPKMQVLNLARTNVGDRGLQSLSSLKKLWRLELGRTRVSNAGLATISQLTQLEELGLYPSEMTDQGLMQLATLVNAKRLDIGPNISVTAASNLRAVLPQCEINRFDATGSASYPE